MKYWSTLENWFRKSFSHRRLTFTFDSWKTNWIPLIDVNRCYWTGIQVLKVFFFFTKHGDFWHKYKDQCYNNPIGRLSPLDLLCTFMCADVACCGGMHLVQVFRLRKAGLHWHSRQVKNRIIQINIAKRKYNISCSFRGHAWRLTPEYHVLLH